MMIVFNNKKMIDGLWCWLNQYLQIFFYLRRARRGSISSFWSISWNFWRAMASNRLARLSKILILNLTSLNSFSFFYSCFFWYCSSSVFSWSCCFCSLDWIIFARSLIRSFILFITSFFTFTASSGYRMFSFEVLLPIFYRNGFKKSLTSSSSI